MPITRRSIVKALAATATVGALPSLAWSASNLSLGGFNIDVLSDGHLNLPADFLFQDLPVTELKAILEKHGVAREQVKPDCNLTLVRDGERTIIFDVGAGPNFMPSAGKMAEALDSLKVDPAEVTHVVFTHAHPDHLWGLLDDFDEPFFSEAQYLINKTEWDYWLDPKTVDTIGANRQAFAAGALRNLKAIEEKTTRFNAGDEILPGIMARGSEGHTPGHTSFEIRSGNESVLVVGDAIGNHHVAFERPDWEVASDQDTTMGAKTRTGLIDQLASEKMRLIGYHLPYPGIGFAEKTGTAYRFVPT